MELRGIFKFFKRLGILFICFQFCWLVVLATASAKSTATLTDFRGTVEVLKQGQERWIPAESNMVLEQGDNIQTGPEAAASLRLEDNSTLFLKENSRLDISELQISPEQQTRVSRFKLWWGVVRTKVEKLANYTKTTHEIETDNAVAGVKLSEMEVRKPRGSYKTDVIVIEGTIDVNHKEGKLEIFVPLCGEVISTPLDSNQHVLITKTDLSQTETLVTSESLSGDFVIRFIGLGSPTVRLNDKNSLQIYSDCGTLIIRTLDNQNLEITYADGTIQNVPIGGLRLGLGNPAPGTIPSLQSSGFTLNVTPPVRTVQAGGDTFYTVIGGFGGSCTSAELVSIQGLPPDTLGIFLSDTLFTQGGTNTQLIIQTSPATPPGEYIITITGAGSGDCGSASDTVTLIVTETPVPPTPTPEPTPTPTPPPPPTPTPVSP